jgi:hypothetical protein
MNEAISDGHLFVFQLLSAHTSLLNDLYEFCWMRNVVTCIIDFLQL